MHLVMAAALLAAPLTDEDPICADLRLMSAAAADAGAWGALYRSDYAPRLLRACFRGDGYLCSQTLLPPEITHATMATRIAACLPGAVAAIAPAEPRAAVKRTMVTGGGLVFELEESGSDRAHVGRMLRIEIRPAKP